MTTIVRWTRLWSQLGSSPPDAKLFDELITRYNEKHRHYHTLRHLDECLDHVDAVRSLAAHPDEIELALWFHDAVYDPRRQDNEALSAEWARTSARAAMLPAESCDRIRSLVQITGSHSHPATTDETLLIDIDLAILGASSDRFAVYEQAIRHEYSWVPSIIFAAKRRSILVQFLERESIFSNRYFIERYEQQARRNLLQSIG